MSAWDPKDCITCKRTGEVIALYLEHGRQCLCPIDRCCLLPEENKTGRDTMNEQVVRKPEADWDWSSFIGSAEGLKWNRKELATIDSVMQYVPAQHRAAVVQAGGNLGVFPKYLSSKFSTVYTFEPEPELFAALCRNAPETNIVKFQAALGCRRGLVGMSRQRRQKDGGNSHEGITHVSGLGVLPTMMVDDLGLSKCGLLYLDIEGYELYALRGAQATIKRCRPTLAIEINKSLEFMNYTEDDIRTFIRTVLEYEHVARVRSDDIFVPRERV